MAEGKHSDDPIVKNWLNQLDETSRQAYDSYWNRFFEWLKNQKGFEKIAAAELLKMQRLNNRKTPTDDDPTPELTLPKKFKQYCNDLPKVRYHSKMKMWTVIRSFYKYNDCPFPEIHSVNIRSDMEPVKSNLTLDIIRRGIGAAKIRDKSWLLVKWQSFQDQERLDYINRKLADHIVSQIRGGANLIRLDFIGRKHEKGKERGAFFSYIGKDAIDALKQHLEESNWKKGEPLWKTTHGRPIGPKEYDRIWREGLLERVGLLPKTPDDNGANGERTGMGLHEFRDVAKSILHTKAKAEGFDMDCIKFWMGHVKQLDPNTYDKFFEDAEYMEKHYSIAEKHLNIISSPPVAGLEEQNEKLEEQKEKLQDLEERVDMLTRIGALQTAALEAGGGVAKLMKEAEKLGYLKITHDRIETTDLFEEKMNREAGAAITRADQTRRGRRT